MLTSEGYKKIGTLDGQEVDLINKDGDVSRGKVWYAGDKETVIMKRVGAPNIECTPDHVFMDNQGNEVEAKDMKGKRLMPYLNAPNHDNRLLVKLGFLQGDGTLSTRTIVANIGQDDDDVLAYFNLTREDAQKSSSVVFNVSEYTDAVETYGIKRVPLIYRTLPEGISKWSDEDKEAFLCGLYSANGSVIGGQGRGRVTLKSVNLELIHGVKDLLEDLGIESYITTNKETDIGFSNGTYTCRESYDLNIGNWEEKQKFFNTIGFIHKYKTDKLREFLTDLSPMVQWVVKGTLQPVYDFSEPITHWGVTEGAIAHNCAEILLDDKQVCNLSVVNMSAFADDNGICDYKGLGRAQTLSARAGYRMTLPDLELKEWDIKQKEHRLTGCSLTGWLDFVEKAELDFEEQTFLLDVLRENAHEANKAIANEHNLNESTNVTATKPDGCWTKEFTRTTDNGIYLIHEIDENIDSEFGFHELNGDITVAGHKVTKSYKNIPKKVIKITTKNNRVLKITESHPMSVNGKWVEARDLKIGDKLDYTLGNYTKNKEKELSPVTTDEFRGDLRDYKLPTTTSPELGWLLGAYYANGCFTTNDRIKFHCQYLEVNEKVQEIWKKLFGVETKIVRSNDRDSYTQDFRSSKITKFFKENGIDKYAENLTIPKVIRESSAKTILSFIIGYADNDGCFHSKTFCIDSRNEYFLRHMQEVAEAVGISFSLITNKERGIGSFSKEPIYKLHMSRAFSDPSIIDYINSISIKARLNGQVEEGNIASKNPYIIADIEYLEEEQTYDIEVDSQHWYYQGGLKSHNTMSLVFGGVSAGVHASHSPYYIRRIRISASDPLVKVCEELGWVVKNEVGQTDENVNTKVIEFPVRSSVKRTKDSFSAIEQLETYKMFQEHYTDQNTSITVTVKEDEWDDVEEWMWNNWDSYVGISFLPSDGGFYQLMPYEEITEEEYAVAKKGIKPFNPNLLKKYEGSLQEYESVEVEQETDPECVNGVCPIR